MPTPYEEMSNLYSSTGNVKTDANLAQDSLMLGGIPAEEYATKVYVQGVAKNIIENCKGYTDEEILKVLEAAKAYTDTVVRNINYSNFATKADLEAAINNAIKQCNEYVNTQITNINISNYTTHNELNTELGKINDYINQIYTELFQSVSSGKQELAEAITDKGISTSASDSFDTMAANVRQISTSALEPGGINTADATATADKILKGYSAYVNGRKLTGTYQPTVANVGDDDNVINDFAQLVYGKVPTEVHRCSYISNNVTFSEDKNIMARYAVVENEPSILLYNKGYNGAEEIYGGLLNAVTKKYTFTELGIPEGLNFVSFAFSVNKISNTTKLGQANLAIVLKNETNKTNYTDAFYVYIYRVNTKTTEIYTENEEEGINLKINKWIVPINYSKITDIQEFVWSTTDFTKFTIGSIGWRVDAGNGDTKGMITGYLIKETVNKTEYESNNNIAVIKGIHIETSNIYSNRGIESIRLINNSRMLLYGWLTNKLTDSTLYHYTNLIILDENMKQIGSAELTLERQTYDISARTEITNDGVYVVYPTGAIKMLSVNYQTGAISLIDEGKTLGITGFEYIRFNSTNEYALVIKGSKTYLYKLDWTQSVVITEEIYSRDIANSWFITGRDTIRITEGEIIDFLEFNNDYEKLLGIVYGDKYYKAQEVGIFTAKARDVTSGKTFVGYNGLPEVGTLGGDTSE